VDFWKNMRPDWVASPEDTIDNLIALFIDDQRVSADLIARQILPSFVDAMIEMRLAEIDAGLLNSDICLFPCYGKYLVTDPRRKTPPSTKSCGYGARASF
jgi:hypothetical protein